MDLLSRLRATRTPPGLLAQVRADLSQGRRALLAGETDRAWSLLQAAHAHSQNSGLLHARVHALRCLALVRRGRPRTAVRELPLVVMATPAALVRRAAGLMPGEAGGRGLLATWRLRRDPQAPRGAADLPW